MLIEKIKAYKWQALASFVMTGLMVASSLLQPRYLQEVLDALLAGRHEAIYSIGAWLIGVALVGKMLFVRSKPFLMPTLSGLMLGIWLSA